MRKTIGLTTFVTLTIMALFVACKKEAQPEVQDGTPNTASTSPQYGARTAPSSLANQVSVSSYGFLVLSDTSALFNYAAFLDGNNANDIASFHNSIGFTSQMTVQGQADNAFTPSSQNEGYFFDQNGVVQIGDIIIRGINSSGYMLAMPASQLSNSTYNALANQTFDRTTMCKLRIGSDYGPSLEAYVKANIGHDGTTDPIKGNIAGKFWGWSSWEDQGPCDGTGHKQIIRHYYVFWCDVAHDYGYVPC